MRYTIAAVIAAIVIALFAPQMASTTEACGGNGQELNTVAAHEIQSGVFNCDSLAAHEAGLAACEARLQDADLTNSAAWFGFEQGQSTWCADRPFVTFGEEPCMDWQTNGPGTGRGIDPNADRELCERAHYLAFFPNGDPTEIGKPINCSEVLGCSMSGDTNPKNWAVAETSSVTFSPPSAGSGGLLESKDTRVAAVGLIAMALVYGGFGLGAIFARRLS